MVMSTLIFMGTFHTLIWWSTACLSNNFLGDLGALNFARFNHISISKFEHTDECHDTYWWRWVNIDSVSYWDRFTNLRQCIHNCNISIFHVCSLNRGCPVLLLARRLICMISVIIVRAKPIFQLARMFYVVLPIHRRQTHVNMSCPFLPLPYTVTIYHVSRPCVYSPFNILLVRNDSKKRIAYW